MKRSVAVFLYFGQLAGASAFGQSAPASAGCANSSPSTALEVAVGSFHRPDTGTVPESFHHSCVLLGDGTVLCFGDNREGQLGVPLATRRSNQPVVVSDLPGPARRIFAGYANTCAITANGETFCWGSINRALQAEVARPTRIQGLDGVPVHISVGLSHACALLPAGTVKCWGANYLGQLGDTTQDSRLGAVDVFLPRTEPVTALAAGKSRSCAALGSGDIYCWGYEADPFEAHFKSASTPELRYRVGEPVLELGTGDYQPWGVNFCALLASHRLYCWGQNFYREVDVGAQPVKAPLLIPALSDRLRSIGMGFGTLFAITRDNQLVAASAGSPFVTVGGKGGTFEQPLTLMSGVLRVAAGWGHVCAILDSGHYQCLGQNDFGQLGDGTFADTLDPQIAY